MNSLRSDSISYFVAQIAFRNQRLNNDSKDLHSSKDLLVRNVFDLDCAPLLSHGASEDLFEETPLVETTALLTGDP